MQSVTIRLLNDLDRIEELNALLRNAYRALAESGLNFAASFETADATRRRVAEGECYVALLEDKIVGCVILKLRATTGPAWYKTEGVASFGRLGVLPAMQGQGVGSKLLDHIETRAAELGFRELALDTAENAPALMRMYEARGYRFIEHYQWSHTNYRSVVMSKNLACGSIGY